MYRQYNIRTYGVRSSTNPSLLLCSSFSPRRFKNVAGIGWYVDEYNLAQISVNCTDFNITNIHTVYESCKDDAREMNLAVVGSELVGLVPLECFLDIADFYTKKENLFIVDERQKVALVIER